MLIIERQVNERVVIDGPCVVTIARVKGGRHVYLGFEAEKSVKILREELVGKTREERSDATAPH